MPKNKRKGLFGGLFKKKKQTNQLQDFGDNSESQDQLSGGEDESSTLDLLDFGTPDWAKGDDESSEDDFGTPDWAMGEDLDDDPDEPSDSESESGPEITFIKEMKVKKKKHSQRSKTTKKVQGSAKKAVKLDDALGAVIHMAGWSRDPAHTKASVNKRFPKGPPISGAEWEALLVLSDDPDGREWLGAAGMFSVQDAQTYLDGGTFRDFHMLHRAQKLILGKMAFEQNLVGTPPFWTGRSLIIGDKTVEKDTREQLKGELDNDLVEEWVKTLEGTELNEDAIQAIQQGAVPDPTDTKAPVLDENQVQQRLTTATAIMKKVFVLLHAGMKILNKEGEEIDFEGPVCKALSHGGRVNVRIPKLEEGEDNKFALMDWLGITNEGETEDSGAVFKRDFGTHHMTVKKDKKDGGKGKFKEDGGKIAAMKSKTGKTSLYGMNLGVGGVGRRDFNGDVILPDGAHGHLFIGFNPPNHKRDGALQVGVETTGPHAPSTVGYVHNWNSTEKTANPISSVGGLKQDKVGHQRIVDLNDLGGDWLGQLSQMEGQLQDLRELVGPA